MSPLEPVVINDVLSAKRSRIYEDDEVKKNFTSFIPNWLNSSKVNLCFNYPNEGYIILNGTQI